MIISTSQLNVGNSLAGKYPAIRRASSNVGFSPRCQCSFVYCKVSEYLLTFIREFHVFDVAYVTYVAYVLAAAHNFSYISLISHIKSIGLRAVSSLGASVGSATWLRGCLLRQGIVLRASAALGRAWHPFGR